MLKASSLSVVLLVLGTSAILEGQGYEISISMIQTSVYNSSNVDVDDPKCTEHCKQNVDKHSKCHYGYCVCEEGYRFFEHTCVKDHEDYGDNLANISCSEDEVCKDSIGANSVCGEEAKCRCNPGYEEYGNGRCHPIRPCSSFIGSAVCMFSVGFNSKCKNQRCRCPDDYVMSNESLSCTKKRVCSNASCVEKYGWKSECSSEQKCRCQEGFHFNKVLKQCTDNPKKNVKHESLRHCASQSFCRARIGEKSYCNSNGRCKCKHGYLYKKSKARCVKRLAHHVCVENFECRRKMGSKSFCSDNSTCICKEGYASHGRGKCHKTPSRVVVWVRNMSTASFTISLAIMVFLLIIVVLGTLYCIYKRCFRNKQFSDLDEKTRLSANMTNYASELPVKSP